MEPEDLQKTAHNHALAGKNFFLTGSAGTGKTYTLHSIIKSLKESKKRVAITACTYVAVQQFGSDAKTIYSFAGYSFHDNRFEPHRSSWNDFDILVIDEISTLSVRHFKAIDKCAKLARGNDLPMGGMQVIGCGDFFQLPPAYYYSPKPSRQSQEFKVDYAFYTSLWKVVFPLMVNLTKVHRQKHQDFIDILNKIRSDEFLIGVHQYLVENCGTVFNPDVPYVYATNKQVEKTNHYMASRLTNSISYTDQFEKLMSLAVGVPVIGLVNNDQMRIGSRGTIVGFEYNGNPYDMDSLGPGMKHPNLVFPVVKFEGYDIPSTVQMFNGEEFPLTYGWAMTIHQVQGKTFESLNVDVSGCFSAGQVYVALSRVPDPSKLNIEGYKDRLVKRGRFVSLFYKSHQPMKRLPGDPEF